MINKTDKDIQKIRELAQKGYNLIQIAEQMKLFPQEIATIAFVYDIKIKHYND